MEITKRNRAGIISLILGVILFLCPFGIFKLLQPFNFSDNRYLILVLGILVLIGFALITIALTMFPKYLLIPYALMLLILTSYHSSYPAGLHMVPPPEWMTEKYGWPLVNREVLIHSLNRTIVGKEARFLWTNSIINFSVYALIATTLVALKTGINKAVRR